MYDKDYARLEALIDKGDPSRLMIDVRLQPPSLGGGGSYALSDLQRAMRDGFREALGEVAFERLVKASNRPKGRARRWLGRACAFAACAAIGGLATLFSPRSFPTPRSAMRLRTSDWPPCKVRLRLP